MQENRGVHGVVLINNEGIPLKTTMVMILCYHYYDYKHDKHRKNYEC